MLLTHVPDKLIVTDEMKGVLKVIQVMIFVMKIVKKYK